MIESLSARDGTPIFKFNRRLLCTSVAPIKEGERWVEQHLRSINSAEGIIVLGLGCGFHVEVLRNNFPQKEIIIIEVEREIINFKRNEKSDFQEIIEFSTLDNLLANKKVQGIVKKKYIILSFYPVIRVNPQKYKEINEVFLGRSELSLSYLLKLKDKWNNVIKKDDKMRVIKDQPYSLKDLMNWTSFNMENKSGAQEVSIINILSELIK